MSAMDDQLILKNRLKVARAEKGLSQTQLAELVGIRPPEIFSMARALDPAALCYTIDEFSDCFQEA